MDAFQFAPRHGEIARLLGAAGEQDGIEILLQRVSGDGSSDVHVGSKLHAFGDHLLQPAVQHPLFHLEFGDAVAQQSADAIGFFENRDSVARRDSIAARRPSRPVPIQRWRLACQCAGAAARAESSLPGRRVR